MRLQVFVFFVLLFAISLTTSAAEDSVYAEKAQTRQYVGGPDESDLKVQAQIQKLQKSKNETNVEDGEGF